MKPISKLPQKSTSWQPVSTWYNQSVGKGGNYYHQHVVLPRSLQLLQLTNEPTTNLLDLACGQGVLARAIPPKVTYYGVDIAPDLIKFAQKNDPSANHHFSIADITKPLSQPSLQENSFAHATCILAMQNLRTLNGTVENACRYLQTGGKFLIVINHPCFRIPRQSSWQVDEAKRTQYRRIDRYQSEIEIPITAHPGLESINRLSHQPARSAAVTWSFHRPLQAYTDALTTSGFVISKLEEWTSDKESVGKAAKMENRSRQEFPLFLALLAQKI